MQAKQIKEGTSGYSRSLPYQHYKSLFTLIEGDDEISGGKADNLTTKDIAKKHRVKTKDINTITEIFKPKTGEELKDPKFQDALNSLKNEYNDEKIKLKLSRRNLGLSYLLKLKDKINSIENAMDRFELLLGKDVNEAKKKPTTKKSKNTKFKKVMKEFGKGKLKSYHAKKNLKSKKQKGSKKEHKQALAIAFSEADMSESSSVAVGYFSGSIISPKDQRRNAKIEKIAKFKKIKKESEELEEEMVHPDDKIGNMMLKKMKVPQPFTSNKKGEVHQKKIK